MATALIADITPEAQRSAAFGLRQSLDTVRAFLGPILAVVFMLLWANDVHTVLGVAVTPAFQCVALLAWGVTEPERAPGRHMAATQRLLAAMVADTAPADLHGAAWGFFNLACGLALPVASALAGWLWDQMGPQSTFFAGALLASLAMLLLWLESYRR